MTITEFLEARIAEDEKLARAAAASDPSSQGYTEEGPAGLAWTASDGMVDGETDGLWDCEGSATLCTTPEIADHIARHDPARVLAECAAKRAIVALLKPEDLRESWDGETFYASGIEDALLALAAVYANHPGYRQEWAL